MIALLTACFFFFLQPCALAELHQQKRSPKLCSATLKSLKTVTIVHYTSLSWLNNARKTEFVQFLSQCCPASMFRLLMTMTARKFYGWIVLRRFERDF